MSYQNTLGFVPYVNIKENKWLSENGKIKFLALVEDKMVSLLNAEYELKLTSEIENIIQKTVSFEENSDLNHPSESIKEAVNYVAIMLTGRIKMHNHLENIRNNPIRLQSRGCMKTPEKKELCVPQLSNTNYEKFLAQNDMMRNRFL